MLGRRKSYRWLTTMSFSFLDVFGFQFAKGYCVICQSFAAKMHIGSKGEVGYRLAKGIILDAS